eukprot:10751229-Alexandrium_andersonii.AAC.1
MACASRSWSCFVPSTKRGAKSWHQAWPLRPSLRHTNGSCGVMTAVAPWAIKWPLASSPSRERSCNKTSCVAAGTVCTKGPSTLLRSSCAERRSFICLRRASAL